MKIPQELLIGILVGVDYYHQFFTGKVIQNEARLVASSSVLGWILSGRFPCAEGSSSCLSPETHSMRYFLEQKPDKNDLLLIDFGKLRQSVNLRIM